MNELSNTVNGTGTYDSVPVSLTSNTSVVKLVDGLTLTLEADKTYWKDGDLKYTITLDNQTDEDYENIVLTDVLDTSLITFVNDSVTINSLPAGSGEYNYEESSHTLTFNLNTVSANAKSVIVFSVKKKI